MNPRIKNVDNLRFEGKKALIRVDFNVPLDDNNNVQQRFNQEYHYGRTLIYDVKHKHMVTPHFDGDRIVDLYFWEVISENESIPDVIKKYQQNNNSKRFKMF